MIRVEIESRKARLVSLGGPKNVTGTDPEQTRTIFGWYPRRGQEGNGLGVVPRGGKPTVGLGTQAGPQGKPSKKIDPEPRRRRAIGPLATLPDPRPTALGVAPRPCKG